MEWITQVQRDFGTLVVDFAMSNWLLVLAMVGFCGWWLYAVMMGRSTSAEISATHEFEGFGDDGGDAAGDGGGD